MKLVETAEKMARRLVVTVAILASLSLTEAPGTAHAQWGGGVGGVDWQWAPAVNAGVPLPAVPYAYGYTYNGIPDHFGPAYAYHPIYDFPGNAGYGNAYASGYAQGYGDGYDYAQGYGDGYGHGLDNGYAGGYGNNVGVYGYGYPGNGYPYPH